MASPPKDVRTPSGDTLSYWMDSSEPILTRPLTHDLSADVCIIGGGIVGMTTAYLLSRENKSVVVLEMASIGSGQTGRTTAHFSNALDDRYFYLESVHGKEGARLAAKSHTAAISRVQSIVESERINCDFKRVPGYLFLGPNETTQLLKDELEASRRAGLSSVQWLDEGAPLPFETGPCLLFPNQVQLHPLKYLHGLCYRIQKMGGKVFTQTAMESLETKSEIAKVRTKDGQMITARNVVIATATPISDRVVIHTKQAPYRTYVIAARIPKQSVTEALYWDTQDPYHYIRTTPESEQSDLLIIGGNDHKTGQSENSNYQFADLIRWSQTRFPMIEEISYQWSGQVFEPVDGLAFIGRDPASDENVFIATGDSGNGMTHGTIAGILITDLILGRKSEWAQLYDPNRFRIKSASTFVKENLNVAKQYLDWLTPEDEKKLQSLPRKSGVILRDYLQKVAVYRDEEGGLHMNSAVCPHLGCIVHWNSAEKSWDCPCHGSRFGPEGEVMNGPAISNLKPIEIETFHRHHDDKKSHRG